MTDPLLSPLVAATAGAYRIERQIGRGGMGAVYLAHDLTLDREVAIKVLPPDLAINATLRERFVREARLAASLSHPNIVHVHAVLEQGEFLAIVMQYVDGETLSQRVARSGPYDAADTARLLQDTAWALGYAHARGIVHRDVKPDNLLIERGTGRPMILDFGIARTDRAEGLTEVGQSIGTPHYMSPEQAAAEGVDGRSDLYSLGCVGFFAATGQTPFIADSAHRLLMLHLTQPAPDVTDLRPEFPKPLAGVIARALKKDRSERYDSAESMAEAVTALQIRIREVAPLLRLFLQQTAQSLQALQTIAIFFVILVLLAPRDDSPVRALTTILLGTMAITIVVQALERVRFAVRQGFTSADIVAAVEAVTDETARGREQLLADPVERARIKRRKLIAISGGFLGGISQPIAFLLLSSTDGTRRQFSLAGVSVLFFGVMCMGLAFALYAMRPVRITVAQRLASHFLKSGVSEALFARAERRYGRELTKAKA